MRYYGMPFSEAQKFLQGVLQYYFKIFLDVILVTLRNGFLLWYGLQATAIRLKNIRD